jgi:hypothetical protein
MNVSRIEPLVLSGLKIHPQDSSVAFSGVISMRNPDEEIAPYLKRVHEAVIKDRLREVVVDMIHLKFMNSSSIRTLIDWVEWVRRAPPEQQYVLHFRSNAEVTWQSTTFGAIEALGSGHVRVSQERGSG